MYFKRILLVGLGLFVCLSFNQAFAIKAAQLDDFKLKEPFYDDRVVLSLDQNDFDFKSTETMDWNNDGIVDYLEENTFPTFEESFSIYVGNASRFELQNTFLLVGIVGEFDSFKLNNVEFKATDVLASDLGKLKCLNSELKQMLDALILVDLESGLVKRSSITSPVSTSIPLEVVFSDLETSDNNLRLYFSGAGSIKSGFNSFSPSDSDVLLMGSANVAAEPISLCLFSIGGFLLGIKNKFRGGF